MRWNLIRFWLEYRFKTFKRNANVCNLRSVSGETLYICEFNLRPVSIKYDFLHPIYQTADR